MSENNPHYHTSISRIRERICFKGAVYHITQRAPGKERIFLEDRDCLKFLRILKEACQEFNFEVYSFALMPNHVHLLFSTNEENLSGAMKNIFECYAKYFNKKYQRKGHVFCGRFRATLCSDDFYLLSCSIYIHLNPYRAGLCVRPEDYEWTSVRLYVQVLKTSFVITKRILSLLAKDEKEAQAMYLKILSQSICLDIGLSLEKRCVNNAIAQCTRVVREICGHGDKNEEIKKLIEKFKTARYVTDLKSQQGRRYLIEQLLANDYSRKEIGEMLGISRSTLARTVKRVAK
ncbi:MAG: transposase [Candidatus Omnitrophota bacterium]